MPTETARKGHDVLHEHRSERADALVEPLAALLADPPDDPFAVDVVAVPTRGVERWLAQRLSHVLGAGPGGEDGVCANVRFGSPSRLVGEALAAVADVDPDDDPWQGDRLVWPLLEVVDECAAEPWCAALGRHLGATTGDEQRRGRRLGVARHLAALFTSYDAQRPHLLRAWAGGEDADGSGGLVPADLAWQPELWRRVRQRLGVPSPAERLDEVLRRLVHDPAAVDLPARLSVFGPTRLPEDQLQVLSALAARRDVHLWLLHPSPALWARTAEAEPASRRRRDRPSSAQHPLLASMARDATELQVRLAALDGPADVRHHPAPDPPDTVLGALQRRLRNDAAPDVPAEHELTAGDRSVQVHACHGRARQVEVLREVLVGLLADDPTLEPRDVLVMCPDIEAIAPLVAATFGLAPEPGDDGAAHPGQSLRVRLADRSLRQTNPLLSLLARLLDLADGRVTASDVLDLAASQPVRRRFSLTDDDLDRVRGWAVAAGVRWGEDRSRRARFGLDAVGQGTWESALDRVLLGAAMAEENERYIGTALPIDDVDSTHIDLAGRLAELLDRLSTTLADLDGVRPLPAWLEALDRALDLLADTAPADAWQAGQARGVLADVRTSGDTHADLPLRLPDLRALLAGRLEGRPTRAGFRTGALTICSLVPMRSVPHRVVALLGLDDGAFPRVAASDGDDLLLRDPLLGERDRRSEDRQLFLDAVSAAAEHLVLLYSGADERTGAARPPAVPVGELLDALDASAVTPDRRAVRDHVAVRHPLQPVDERNFTDGALGRPGPFSADAVGHAAALAGRGDRRGAAPFLTRPLPPVPWDREIDLDDLVRALEHPVREFLRTRLGVRLAGRGDDVDDRLPLDLPALDRWAVGDRLLAAALAGAEPARALDAERRRGQVPPGNIGGRLLAEVGAEVDPLVAAALRHRSSAGTGVDVTADLPGERSVVGTVPGVHGDVLLRAVYSKLGPKHRLRAWAQLLALAVARPDRPWTAVTVGRFSGRTPSARVATLRAPPAPVAVRRLAELVALRDQALREPLPAPVGAAAAYARSRAGGDAEVQALEAASRAWVPFEQEDAEHVLVWGEGASLDALSSTPWPVERTWWPDEGTRFGVLARRVWDPLLASEEVRTA